MQNFCLKPKKICAIGLILCLIWGLAPTAESISVKLRGKIALGGILSCLAYVTYTLVKRDKRAVEELHLRLGPPDRVVQFERGFDLWRIDSYGKQSYVFRNNRLMPEKPLKAVCSTYDAPPNLVDGFDWKVGRLKEKKEGWKYGRKKPASTFPIFHTSILPPFLIDTPFSGNPKWLQLYPLHPRRAPRLVSSYLYRLGDEHLLDQPQWLSH